MLMSSRLKFDLNILANEMLDSFDPALFESKKTTFLDPAMGGGQFLKAIEDRLRSYGHSDKNIAKRVTGYAENPLHIAWSRKYRGIISHIEVKNINEIKDMKFDVGLGNPPFSEIQTSESGWGGKTVLYPTFFKVITDICDVGAMIMPPTRVNNTRFRKHVELIKSVAHDIVEVSEEQRQNMGVGTDMWTVYWGSEGNVDKHFTEVVVRNDVNWNEGRVRFGFSSMSEKKTKTHKIRGVKAIFKDGPKHTYTNIVKEMPKAGWYLLLNREVNEVKGFNTSVVKLDGNTQLGTNVRYVRFETKKDAVQLESKMNSPDVIAQLLNGAGSIRKAISLGTLRGLRLGGGLV